MAQKRMARMAVSTGTYLYNSSKWATSSGRRNFFLHTGFSLVFVAAVKQQHNGRKGGKVKSLGPAGDGNGLVPGSKDDAAGGFLVDAGQIAQGIDEFGNLAPAQILHQGVLVQLAQAHAAAHGAFDPVQIILVLVRRAGYAALGLRQHFRQLVSIAA